VKGAAGRRSSKLLPVCRLAPPTSQSHFRSAGVAIVRRSDDGGGGRGLPDRGEADVGGALHVAGLTLKAGSLNASQLTGGGGGGEGGEGRAGGREEEEEEGEEQEEGGRRRRRRSRRGRSRRRRRSRAGGGGDLLKSINMIH